MSDQCDPDGGFCILLKRPQPPDPMKLARALAAVWQTPVQDHMAAARRCRGILAEHLEESAARKLREGLTAAGLECVLVPDASLMQLPPARMLKDFTPAITEGLAVIAAAALTVTSTRTRTEHQRPTITQTMLSTGIMLATGLPIPIGPRNAEVKKEVTHSDLRFYADLLYRDPSRRLRIDAQVFDYSFLKERRLYFAPGNFKLLLSVLAEKAPQAWRNHGAKVVLEGLPINTMGYETMDDLERESRWLLTLQSHL